MRGPVTRTARRLAGTPRTLRAFLRMTALACVILAGLCAVGAGLLYWSLDGNIRTDDAGGLSDDGRPVGTRGDNILLLGVDDRSAPDGRYGEATGSVRADTAMLIHLPPGGKRVRAVNIPRDLLVDIPSCRKRDGDDSRPTRGQFNWAYEIGGTTCTVRTFENLTDIRVDHHLVVDFLGFKDIVNAVGGVEVDLPAPESDPNVGLDLPAGRQVLRDEDALAYMRARVHVGDGSDGNRIHRQHEFLKLLLGKLSQQRTLTDPTRLYPALRAATSSLTADRGLDSLPELYGLAKTLRGIPAERIEFGAVPAEQYPDDPNRLILKQPEARQLFAVLREESSSPGA